MANGTWLKRIIVGLIAAIVAVFFSIKKAAAPGKKAESEFTLPPVPDARASGPEDATPLTEEEQAALASRAPAFKGYSAPGSDESVSLTEDDTGSSISDEIATEDADNAQELAESSDDDADEALDELVFFTAPEVPILDVPPPISYEIAKKNADAAEELREAGDAEGADALEKRIYFATPSEGSGEPEQGDTSPEPTSEAFDIVTDGADHTGQHPAEFEDPTSVGLDIDVDLDDDEPVVPELTSEGFDTGAEALGIAATSSDAVSPGFITVPDSQTWCPDDFPIKGNASSKIFHKPGESSYDATNPEICFATDEAAIARGFRARKR